VVAHGLVAVGIVAYMKYAPGPTAIATLDLSSVDLSFAEDEDETAAVSPTMPATPEVEPPKPREEKPPEPERVEDPLPPDPAAPKLAEPDPTESILEQAPARPARESTSDEVAQAPSTGGSAAQAPKQAKIDAPPKPHKTIKPDYPKGARQRGEQGEVILEIRVNAAGNVDRVDIVSSCGFPELDEAAVRAARTARFTPAKSGGSPVASTARLTLNFKLK
jgi:protein TonB